MRSEIINTCSAFVILQSNFDGVKFWWAAWNAFRFQISLLIWVEMINKTNNHFDISNNNTIKTLLANQMALLIDMQCTRTPIFIRYSFNCSSFVCISGTTNYLRICRKKHYRMAKCDFVQIFHIVIRIVMKHSQFVAINHSQLLLFLYPCSFLFLKAI